MRLRLAVGRTALLVLTSLVLSTCGGSDSDPTPPDDGTDIEVVTVSPASATIDIGGAQQLSAQVVQKNGSPSSTSPTWSATPAGIVDVSGTGLVTGLGEGAAVVRATAGGRSGEATITVNDPDPPAAPSAVAVEALSHTVVEVSWTDHAHNEDEFRVERETVTGAAGAGPAAGSPQAVFSQVATLPANTTSYRDDGLEAATAYRYRVRACNQNGCTPAGDEGETTTEAVTTHEVLVMETTSLPSGVVGAAYAVALSATGGAATRTWSVAEGALPQGLSLGTTGMLDGTPEVAGTFPLTLEVASGEQTATLEADLVVTEETLPPEVTTESLPAGAVGVPYAAALAATLGDGSYAWAITDGALPDGVVLDPGTGVLGGTPTAAGSFDFTVEVTSAELTGDRELTIIVHEALAVSTTDLPSGVVGGVYAATLTAEGGDGTYQWSVSEGALPDGLTLDAATGLIEGTPTAAGAADVTVRVESGDAQQAEAALTLDVHAVLAVTTASLPDGQVGQAYEHALEAEGGDGAYTWSVVAGALPEGVSLAEGTGVVGGRSTEDGTFDFTARAASGDGQTADAELALTVAPGPPSILTASLPNGTVGVAYDATLEAAGGDGSYTWAVTVGDLPDGLSLDGGGGAVTGTPTTAGTADFTIEVTSGGDTDARALSITIEASGGPLAITTTSLPDARTDVAYAQTIVASGGSPPYTWSVSAGALPGGVLLAAGDGALSGAPTASGSASFTVQVSDNLGDMATQALTLAVCPAVLDLAVGEAATVVMPEDCGAVLPDVDGDFRTALLPRSIAGGAASVPGGLKLTGVAGTPGSEFPAPPAATPYPLRGPVTGGEGLPSDVLDLEQRTERLHYRLRDEERRTLSGAPGVPAGPLGPPLETLGMPRVEATPAATRTFWVIPGSGTRIEIPTTLLGESASVWYYADDAVLGTSDEPSQTQIDDLLAYYEAYGKPVIDGAFGGLGPAGTTQNFKDGPAGPVLMLPTDDIDENGGRLVVLQVRPAYMLSGAAAYVSYCDRFPRLENHNAGFYCDGSNQAEITYLSKPQGDFYLGSLVHEVKHISSFGYAAFAGRDLNPSWIEEGTAEIAKEKSSRDAAGAGDGVELGYLDVYPGGIVSAATYGMAVVTSRARAFLGAAPVHSLYGNPSPNPNGSTFYGASWLFHRFLADNYAGGNEDAFMLSLNTGGAGVAHIEAVTGRSLGTLLEEFVLAVGVEGVPAARAAAAQRFVSYDFAAIAAGGFGQSWPYVLTTAGFVSGSVTLSSAVFGGPSYFDFEGTGSTGLRLDAWNASDLPLAAAHDVVLLVIRIR